MISSRTGRRDLLLRSWPRRASLAAARVAAAKGLKEGGRDARRLRLHAEPDQGRLRPGHVQHHQRRHLEGVRDGAQELVGDHPRRERERRRGRPRPFLAQPQAGQLRRQLPQRRQRGPGQARRHRHGHRSASGRLGDAAAERDRALPDLRGHADRTAAARHPAVRRRAQERLGGRGPRRCSAPPGSTTRRSSRWPRASATSTPRSTRASTTSPTSSSGPAFTGSSRCCGSTTRPEAPRAYADELMADVNTLSRKVQDDPAAAGPAGQRRRRADE